MRNVSATRRTFLGLGALTVADAITQRQVTTSAFATSKRKYGCYRSGDFDVAETEARTLFSWYSCFIDFDSNPAYTANITKYARSGKNLLIAFSPTGGSGVHFADILAGRYDAFLTKWFNYLRLLGRQVFIRWAWEMNGAFMPWSPKYVGASARSSQCRDTAQYVAVWRYVVALQRATPTPHNTRWYFCANQNDTSPLPLEGFYPGSGFVQVVGYDSYNGLNGKFMSGADTLAGATNGRQPTAYSRVTALHPSAEVWIGETGCVDQDDPKDLARVGAGHSKARWWAELFACSALPRLTTVNFFDAQGARNWTFASSPESLAALRAGIAD